MPVQLKSIAPSQPVERRIAETEKQIQQQEATIARLAAEGHEVADATRFLRELQVTLAGLRREHQQAS